MWWEEIRLDDSNLYWGIIQDIFKEESLKMRHKIWIRTKIIKRIVVPGYKEYKTIMIIVQTIWCA